MTENTSQCPNCGERLYGGGCASPDCYYEGLAGAIGHGGDHRDFIQKPAPLTDEQRAREWRVSRFTFNAIYGTNRLAPTAEELDAMLAAYAAHVLSTARLELEQCHRDMDTMRELMAPQHRPGVQVHPADCGWTDKEDGDGSAR